MAISLQADPTLAQGYIQINGTTAATVTAAGIVSGGVPAGAVMPFAMNSAPAGWLAADGTEYSKTGTYAALFAAIGTTHGETNGSGGSGTSHFRVPDLRGIFVRGSGSQTITGDTYSGTFAAKQKDEIKAHTHTLLGANNTSGAGLQITRMADNMSNFQSGSFGGAETRPANIALLYCIKH